MNRLGLRRVGAGRLKLRVDACMFVRIPHGRAVLARRASPAPTAQVAIVLIDLTGGPNMPPDDAPFSCPCGDPLLESLRPLIEPCLRLARDGQLPDTMASALASGELAQQLLPGAFRDVHHAATLSRTLFQRSVAWPLFSEQWLDALAR